MKERWRPIPGEEGRYDVSDRGRVRSLVRAEPRILKQFRNKTTGYLAVALGRRRVSAHRLVLLAFRGPCPVGMETRHADGCSANNRLANLSWGTKDQNAIDKKAHGTDPVGVRNPCAILTPVDVRAIRASYIPRVVTYAMLGESYGVSADTVRAVVVRRSWDHIP